MQYQSDGTQVNARPVPAAIVGTPGWVTGGNPAAGQPASNDDADVMNQILDELVGLVKAANLVPSKTDSTQVLQAVRALPPGRLLNVYYLQASTAYTPSTGTNKLRVTVTGAGGGGSNCISSNTSTGDTSGGGGGGGGVAISLLPVSAVTAPVPVTVGTGGGPQAPGGASSFGTYLSASGGSGASFPTTGTSSGAIGGVGTGGNLANLQGGEGSDGQAGSLIFVGNGAPGPFGGGGRAGAQGGLNGIGWGAGGGGAYDPTLSNTTFHGGTGSGGVVIIEEYS